MENNSVSAFLVAGPKSNSGKTTITMALIRAFAKRGICVQPYKCGPDYIDPMYHSKMAGRPSYNLDSWMSSEQHVQKMFQSHLPENGVAVVEGVMGLFDGARKDEGSSAEIARLLDIPVILIVDAASMAYSATPLLFGFKNFDPRIRMAGVIFNKVSGESHYRFLEEAARDAGVESLGYLPKDERLSVKSRHLGLHLPEENKENLFQTATELIEKHIRIDKLLEITSVSYKVENQPIAQHSNTFKIAIAKDAAFNFSYQANIDALNRIGSVTFFSPLHDREIPDADLLWFPGGYPELFAHELAQNESMIQSVEAFIDNNKIVIGECGGMMYLGNEIVDENGKGETMCGIFNISTSFEKKKLHLGYRRINWDGLEIKGHEFHYSNLILHDNTANKFEVSNARGENVEMPIFRHKNCWASYMHLYLGEAEKLENFLNGIVNHSI